MFIISQYYDNAAKFVATEYMKPFTELILGYPDAVVLEHLATEQITLKSRQTDTTMKVQFPDETAALVGNVH